MTRNSVSSLAGLELFAQSLAESPVRVFVLQGELGAGKTTLVRLFAKRFGLERAVSSPTFALMNVYEGNGITIHHFDLYRLSAAAEASEWGFEEYAAAADYNFIEWAERAWELIPKPYVLIRLEHTSDENTRLIFTETVS